MIKNLIDKYFGINTSFRRQLLTMIVIGIVTLSLLGSLLTAWVTSYKIRELIINDAIQEVNVFAELALLALVTGSTENANDAIEHVLNSESVIGAAVIDAENKLIANYGIQDEFIQTQQLDKSLSVNVHYDECETYFRFWKVVLIQQGDLGLGEIEQKTEHKAGQVIIKVNKNILIDSRRDIFLATFLIGTSISAFLVILVNLTVNRLIRPIFKLAGVMAESEQTGMHLQSKVEGPKEFRRMARAYNLMIKVLDQQDEELRLHRDQLEHEVQVRTQELVSARDSALTASRHKSIFLANVTHELRTPIQAIIGYIDLVKEELELDGQLGYLDDLAKVQRNSERLLSLINSILDLSKVEAGRMELKNSTVEVKLVIQSAIDTITPLLDKWQNLLVGPQSEIELFVETDKDKLEQILINLLSNACKFTKMGTISIDYCVDESTFTITVSDTGRGIPAEQLKDIFDEFRQVSQHNRSLQNGNSKEFEGTGLGLAISQKFALLMGGEIQVTSQVGVGTEFKLVLPL